jgi:hypothetical protein
MMKRSRTPFLLPVWGLRLRVANADLSRKPILTASTMDANTHTVVATS